MFLRDMTGPLYDLNTRDLEPRWQRTFGALERITMVLHLHRLQYWLRDRYINKHNILFLHILEQLEVLYVQLIMGDCGN